MYKPILVIEGLRARKKEEQRQRKGKGATFSQKDRRISLRDSFRAKTVDLSRELLLLTPLLLLYTLLLSRILFYNPRDGSYYDDPPHMSVPFPPCTRLLQSDLGPNGNTNIVLYLLPSSSVAVGPWPQRFAQPRARF